MQYTVTDSAEQYPPDDADWRTMITLANKDADELSVTKRMRGLNAWTCIWKRTKWNKPWTVVKCRRINFKGEVNKTSEDRGEI